MIMRAVLADDDDQKFIYSSEYNTVIYLFNRSISLLKAMLMAARMLEDVCRPWRNFGKNQSNCLPCLPRTRVCVWASTLSESGPVDVFA